MVENNQASLIFHYFTNLSSFQQEQFIRMGPLYAQWNSCINLISRKDIDKLYLRHVLHSLAIAKVIHFKPGTTVIDIGTGGGFPGIPLAILFPQIQFHLIDSVAKKVKVVQEIAQLLGLSNVTTQVIRAEAVKAKFDFILGRAINSIEIFYKGVQHILAKDAENELPNGILYLRGIIPLYVPCTYHSYAISQFFNEPFFQSKQLVHLYP